MTVDWTRGMRRTYEYWEVDPGTWKDARPLDGILSCEITREDAGADDDVLVSAVMESLGDVASEAYVRAYMVVEQPAGSGSRERVCLDTFLAQSPSASYNGKREGHRLECFGPLVELRDDSPSDGHTVAAGSNVRKAAAQACRAHCRAPVEPGEGPDVLAEPFVASGDTWLSFVRALLRTAGLALAVDAYGRITFAPDRDAAALSPMWAYRDDDGSVMLPDLEDGCDWMGLPNTYRAIVSGEAGCVVGEAVNDSPSSAISTVSRGRTVLLVDDAPDLPESATQALADAYARKMLRRESRAERSVEFTHLFNGTRLGDCVSLDYTAHSLSLRAKVVRQVVPCTPSCQVAETATYARDYWR